MYIYNITFQVDREIEKDWLDFLKNNFIPKMLASGHLQSALTSKVIGENDTSGTSYSVQFKTENKQTLDKFLAKEFQPVLNEIYQKFYPKMLFFSTELDVLDEIQ